MRRTVLGKEARMFSTWTMIGVGLSALTLLVSGTAQGRADAVTVTFQDRVKGYAGTRDVSLSQQNPDRSNGKGDDILVGRIFDDDVSRFKGLVPRIFLFLPDQRSSRPNSRFSATGSPASRRLARLAS